MDRMHTLVLGAVAYDPKVVTIWDGFRDFFNRRGLAFDYVLFSNYERQVEAHLSGQIDVAWNSPLAWIETERVAQARGRRALAIAMRDTDCDLSSLILARGDSSLHSLADLRGKRVGVGASDSPQATLIPLLHIARETGLTPGRDFEVVEHDLLPGKHGDHVGGERAAARALRAGTIDAICMIDGNQLLFAREGTLAPGATRILGQTSLYDHCNFTVLEGEHPALVESFRAALLAMSYDDPEVRPLLDLEGLREWRPGRTSGYGLLNDAVDRTGYLDLWLRAMEAAPKVRA
jgi:ABC-type phosphate/phosphonate transport system substrate-binding protein